MGPLTGVKIIEFAGVGPTPFCAMMLADMGAEILRIDRYGSAMPGIPRDWEREVLNRGRQSVALNLKMPQAISTVRKLCRQADGVIEGFRPGVMERLGLGPEICLKDNPRLIYGRMTGWGQSGPWAQDPGHDINYIAVAGALYNFRREGQAPVPPLNLLGDFGGGGMLLAFGMACALFETERSGKGQVIDAAMIDGVSSLMAMIHSMISQNRWPEAPGRNLLDGGAPFYNVYETADGEYVAVGAIEPKFYANLIEVLELDSRYADSQFDVEGWPELKEIFAACFKRRSRGDWESVFEGRQACVTPVLSPAESARHPQMAARQTLVNRGDARQPAPAPRFSRTPGAIGDRPEKPGGSGVAALKRWGVTSQEIAALQQAGGLPPAAGALEE